MKILKWKAPNTALSLLILTAITLGCLLPFIGKAFHIDDPLYIWCARHIRSNPFDFYGFNVNWDGQEEPMSVPNWNPPLVAYYMALIGALVGWSEVALHTGFLLPAVALVIGTYFLARKFCSHPLWAALMTVAAPGFLLSSTSIMCDTMMTAFWVWSVYFWVEGLETGSAPKLCLAALLIAACSMTKYFGLSLVPLLFTYSLWKQRRIGRWIACLLLPVIMFAFYQWLTCRLYGHGLFANAVSGAINLRVGGGLASKILTGLAFSGGCMIILLPAAPLLLDRRGLAAGVVALFLIGFLALAIEKAGSFSVIEDTGTVKWLFVAQFSLFTVTGVGLIFLAVADLLEQKTPASVLLFLWVVGTFVFACAVNWTVSGRNILPLIPGASILLIRHLETRWSSPDWNLQRRLVLPLGISLGMALLVTYADYRLAGSARAAALDLKGELTATSTAIRFEGHWGFQYYMETLGATALDRTDLHLGSHDTIVIPTGNSYLFLLPESRVTLRFVHRSPALNWLTTMNGNCGAGYYSDGWGPLPFVFGPVPAEEYLVFQVK